jgi:hypothetical protein
MLIENVQLGGTQIGIIIPYLFELIRENSRSMYKKNLIVWTKNSTFLLQELKTLTCTPECSWRIFSWTIKESSFISQSNKKSYWINGLFLGSFRHPTLFKIDSSGFNRCISFSFTRYPGCPFLQTSKKEMHVITNMIALGAPTLDVHGRYTRYNQRIGIGIGRGKKA